MTASSLLLFVALALASGRSDAAAEAQRLARRSIVEYDGGHFEQALADADQAYALEPAPGLLYNLAQCHRALHHWEQAEFFFKGYLRGKPGAANRTAVLALIDEMEKNRLDEIAEKKAAHPEIVAVPVPTPQPAATPPGVAVAPAPAPQPVSTFAVAPAPEPPPVPVAAVEAPAPRRHIPASAWALGAVGLVAGIAGGVAYGLVASDRSGYTGAGQQPATVSYPNIQQSNTFAVAGNILVPVGAGLFAIATGIAIFGSSPAPNGAP